MAEKSGLHQTYIGLLERGERNPNLDTVMAGGMRKDVEEMIQAGISCNENKDHSNCMKTISLKTTNLTPEKADFITTQCERALQRTLDDRTAIQQKGTVVLGVFSAIIVFGINSIIQNSKEWPSEILPYVILELLILVGLGLPLVWSYLPSVYASHGYDPSKIIEGKYINQGLEKMKIGYAYELQNRISYNRNWNEKTGKQLKQIVSVAIISPIIALLLVRLLGCLVAST